MKNKNILIIIAISIFLILFTTNVYGNSSVDTDFWGAASKWFSNAKSQGAMTNGPAGDIMELFTDMINVIGTAVITIATVVTGIRYVMGTVDTKVAAKEGLITLFVACVFFFGWTAISNLLFPNNDFVFTSDSDTSYKNIVARILHTFSYIGNIVSIILIVYVGIKYIFSGATGKADLKGRSPSFIIGVILIFATTNVLTFISNIVIDMFE